MIFACLIIASVSQFTYQQAIVFDDGGPTRLLDKECDSAGLVGSICIEVKDCPQASKAIQNGVRPIICGWSSPNKPLVCCNSTKRPDESVNLNTCAPVISSRKRRQSSLLLVTFSPTNVTTKTPVTTVKPLVIGGIKSEEGSRPWMVAFLEKGNGDPVSRLICGGSLVSERHVITAAHCFEGRPFDAALFEVVIGSNNISLGRTIDISEIILHPDYGKPTWYNDIAIVKLARKMTFNSNIRPICLPPPAFKQVKFTATVAKVAGWGTTEFGGDTSEQLLEVELPTIANDKCNFTFLSLRGAISRYPQGINDQLMCAGHDAEIKDACSGDSGGPLFWPDRASGRWLLIGIVSTGYHCAIPGIPGIYTRATWHLDWIQENLK